MQHRVTHNLSPDLARSAVRKAVASYMERFAKYAPVVRWQGEDRAEVSFCAQGLTLSGSLRLEPGAIVIELDVPFLLRPLQGKALQVIDAQVRQWIGVAEAGGE